MILLNGRYICRRGFQTFFWVTELKKWINTFPREVRISPQRHNVLFPFPLSPITLISFFTSAYLTSWSYYFLFCRFLLASSLGGESELKHLLRRFLRKTVPSPWTEKCLQSIIERWKQIPVHLNGNEAAVLMPLVRPVTKHHTVRQK